MNSSNKRRLATMLASLGIAGPAMAVYQDNCPTAQSQCTGQACTWSQVTWWGGYSEGNGACTYIVGSGSGGSAAGVCKCI